MFLQIEIYLEISRITFTFDVDKIARVHSSRDRRNKSLPSKKRLILHLSQQGKPMARSIFLFFIND